MSKNNTPATKPAATEKASTEQAGGQNPDTTAAGGGLLESGGATGAGPSTAQITAAETDAGAAAVVDAALGGTQTEFTEAATATSTPPSDAADAADNAGDAKARPKGKKYETAVDFGSLKAGHPITAADLKTYKDKTGETEFRRQLGKGNIVESKGK